MKKLCAVLATLLLLTLCTGCALAYEHETKSLPTELPESWDYTHYYQSPVVGYYEAQIFPDENLQESRTLNIYYAEGILFNCEQVFITVPAGVDAYDFIVDSGWKQVADENKLILYIMTAKGDAWGEIAEEKPYVDAVAAWVTKKPFFSTRRHDAYWALYDGKNIGLSHAMIAPPDCAGFVVVNAPGLTEADVAANAAITSKYFDGENNPVNLTDVQYLAWIVSEEKTEDVQRMIDYYKKADGTFAEASACDLFANTEFYAPDPDNKRFDLDEFQVVGGVYYTQADAAAATNYEFTSTMWKNMMDCQRRAPHYGQLMEYMGLDTEGTGYAYHEAMINGGEYTDEQGNVKSDDYLRYWFTYTPSNIDNLDKVPVIFVNHGNGGSPNEMGEGHYWRQMAEQYGYVMIVTQGSIVLPTKMNTLHGLPYYNLNNNWSTTASAVRPNDLLYVDYLHHWVLNDYDYASKIDASRIYVTGQSLGGGWTETMVAYRPYLFAAAAPCSMLQTAAILDENADLTCDIPVVPCMAQKDDQASGGFSLSDSSMVNGKAYFDFFPARYGLTERGGLGRKWEDFTFLVSDAVCTEDLGILNTYVYVTPSDIPMFVAVEQQGMGHATGLHEVRYVIDNFFEHFSRDPETKVLYYDGKVVDTPVNLALAEAAK